MRRAVLTTIAVLVLVLTGAVGGSVGAPSPAPAATADALAGLDPDTVLLRVDLRPDGTAHWHVEYRVELATDNETEAFEDYRRDVKENPGEFRREFRNLMSNSVRKAKNATGREMRLRNVTVRTERDGPPERGEVIYEFEWTNFSVVDGATIRAGDALSGFYVSEETTLMFTWPGDYRASVSPEAHERRPGVAAWTGPMEFTADEPRLVLDRRSAATPTTEATAGGGNDGSDGGPGASGNGDGLDLPIPVPVAGAGVGAIVALGVVGWTLARRTRPPTPVGNAEGADGNGNGNEDETSSESGDVGGDGSGAGSDGDDGGGVPSPPPELMSNEERVLAALDANGGRLKQQELADELDWKAPKTSKVVQGLRDEDEVVVFRLGRENVVSLPDADPRDVGGT